LALLPKRAITGGCDHPKASDIQKLGRTQGRPIPASRVGQRVIILEPVSDLDLAIREVEAGYHPMEGIDIDRLT
jgi:hypothetical protein